MLAIRVDRAFDGLAPISGGATVFVEGSQIAGVECAGAAVPDGCEELRFPNGTLLPGLIDMHVHLGGDGHLGALDRLAEYDDEQLDAVIRDSMRAHLAAGTTTVRDVGDRMWSVVDWRDRITRAGDAGHRYPTVVASGPPITCVQGHCWSMGGAVDGIEQLRRAVQERVERGVDVIKVMASGGVLTPGTDITSCQFSIEEMRVVVETAHDAGIPVTSHAHGLAAVERSVEAGVDGIEHCTCIGETGISVSDDLLKRFVDHGTVICPTLGLLPGLQPPPHVQTFLQQTGATREARLEATGKMLSFGVRVVSGVDAGIGDAKPHGIVALAVADLVEAGATTPQAMASATSLAAQAAGLAGSKGRLAAGLDADLLVVDGDPLSNINDLSRVDAVFRSGTRVAIGGD